LEGLVQTAYSRISKKGAKFLVDDSKGRGMKEKEQIAAEGDGLTGDP